MDPNIKVLLYACHPLTQWEHANLSAPFWRFYWNDRPGGAIISDGKIHCLTPDICAIIGPETPYGARLRRPVRHLYIHFLTAAPMPHAPFLQLFAAAPLKNTLRELRDRLASSAGATPRGAVLAHYLVSYALLQIPAEMFRAQSYDSRVEATIRRLEENPAAPPDNAFLAAEAGMNRNSFIRLFRQATGCAPQKYVARLRIERACHLLHCGQMSIKEIAATLGFCDRYHFSKVFRKWRGMGPAEFRRRLGKTWEERER